MKNNRKILLGIAALVVVILVMACVYAAFGPGAQVQTGTKAYTVTVVSADESTQTYEGFTDAEYLRGLIDELQAAGEFTYEGIDTDYGIYITAINGETADYDADGAYWAIYVNGVYGMYGTDIQPVADGDTFEFVYEIYPAQ